MAITARPITNVAQYAARNAEPGGAVGSSCHYRIKATGEGSPLDNTLTKV